MNANRLKRKLDYLKEAFKGESRNSEKARLLKKINEVESQINLPLTKDNVPKIRETIPVEKDKYSKNKSIEEKIFKYTEEEIDKMIMSNLSKEEAAFVKSYKEWYQKKKIDIVNIKQVKKRRSNDKVDLNELMVLSNRGYTATEIAKMYGVHQSAISKRQIKYFDKVYSLSQNRYFKPLKDNWNGLSVNILCRLLNEGMNDTQIAKKFGITQRKVTEMRNKTIYMYYKFKEEVK